MSIQNENTLHAVAVVDGDGTLLAGQGITQVIRSSAGTYLVGLELELAASERVLGLSSEIGFHEAVFASDTVVQVETFSSLGADTDSRFHLEVHRLPTTT